MTNIVANSGFEDPNSKAWVVTATYGGGSVNISDTANSHTGSHSALLRAINTTLQCPTNSECKDTVRATIEQYIQSNNSLTLNNLAATNDSFSAWWYVANPSSTGLPTYSLHVGLAFSDGSNIEYFYGISDLFNQRYNLGPIPATGSWFQMHRNLLSDIQGVVVNPSATRITTVWFGAFGGTSQNTLHGEKAWVDDVALNFSAGPYYSGPPSFTIGLNTSSLSLAFGSQATLGGMVRGQNGFNGIVGLSVNTSPVSGTTAEGITVSLVPNTVTLSPQQPTASISMTILAADPSLRTYPPVGNFTVTVFGYSAPISSSAILQLMVQSSTASNARLQFSLGYRGVPSPGATVQLQTNFTNVGTLQDQVTELKVWTDFGTFTQTTGLPLALDLGQKGTLSMNVSLPSNILTGIHTISATVFWQYYAPPGLYPPDNYISPGGWGSGNNGVVNGTMWVTSSTPSRFPFPGSGFVSGNIGTVLAVLAVYAPIVAVAAGMVIRSDRRKQRRMALIGNTETARTSN
jgi:hypothetical protein